VFDFKKITVENEIGMRREDNPDLFNSVYRQMFGEDYERENANGFEINDDNDY